MASEEPKYHEILIRLADAGRPLRILSLREILAIKARAGRPKDLAAIPYIQSTIDEIESQSG